MRLYWLNDLPYSINNTPRYRIGIDPSIQDLEETWCVISLKMERITLKGKSPQLPTEYP